MPGSGVMTVGAKPRRAAERLATHGGVMLRAEARPSRYQIGKIRQATAGRQRSVAGTSNGRPGPDAPLSGARGRSEGYLYGSFQCKRDPTIQSAALIMAGTSSRLLFGCPLRSIGRSAVKACRGVRPSGDDGIQLFAVAPSSGPHPHDESVIRPCGKLVVAARPAS